MFYLQVFAYISDDDEVDSFIGQNASSTSHDEGEMLPSAAVLDDTSVDIAFSTAMSLTSSGQLLSYHLQHDTHCN